MHIYHRVEGWNYLDSTYFLVITATTIGYGDLTPQTDLGKIITIFYSFVGIAVVFYLISLIGNFIFKDSDGNFGLSISGLIFIIIGISELILNFILCV